VSPSAWDGVWIDDIPTLIAALTPARLAVWPALGGAGATLAAAVRDGRRRTALNERLHELRRPLQALALMAPAAAGGASAGDGPVEMAAAALARLEREINGEGEAEARAALAVRPLLEAARRRWSSRAALAGATVALRWDAGEAAVEGDRIELAAAIDNLISNALEHGGPRIELAADLVGGRICLAVVDSGSGAGRRTREREALLRGREARRRREARAPFARLSGRARHGHGLRLVRRTAEEHGGTFALHRGEQGTSAVLELPLLSSARRTHRTGSQDDRDGPERTSMRFVREGPSRSSLGRGHR
jgi:two-component system sensor histidine kinase MtrB